MAVTIQSISLIGTPPTQLQITGTYNNCEKIDVWVSCDQMNPGAPLLSYSLGSPFTITVNLPRTCHCGDTISVWIDCHQGLGVPSTAAASTSLSFDCDCCPQVSLAAPIVAYPGGVATASFALSAPVSWAPAGCTPPVTITGYVWTLTQGATQYQETTMGTTASTDTGSWTSGGATATLPLALTAGSWDIKVRPAFSAGQLSANCDPSDSTSFSVTGMPTQCCPFDPKTAPNGVTVAVVETGMAPAASATFTATVHWPKKCTPVTPTQYVWEVTDPANEKYSRTTTSNVTYANDAGANWTRAGALVGALPLVAGNFVVVCTAMFPANSSASGCPAFGSATFTVAASTTPPPPNCCPSVAASATITGTTGSFSATVTWPAGCPSVAASSFAWTVTDTTKNASFTKSTTTATTDQTGFTPALTITPGDSYSLSVTPTFAGVTLPPGCNPGGSTTTTAPPTTTPTSSGSSLGCAILLVIAIILLLLGGIVVAIGICISVVWVWIVGIVIGAVGAILFAIWAFICAAFTPCSLMITMECILDWIVKLGWIVAIIAAIVGGLPCGLASIAVWGGWAVLDSILRTIMFRVGCPPIDCTKPHP
ncbi:MAG TPA: hypothetical protein VME68_11305 [Acidobacteriaceae bacterium]|nr:hypothetical protein [Acidobacteriaceae bacterium]